MTEKRAMSRPRLNVLRLAKRGRLRLGDDFRLRAVDGEPFSKNAWAAARDAGLVGFCEVTRFAHLTSAGREALRRAEGER